ncbi:MAG TPA: hypothetical protein DCG47_14440 [Spirochaetaceae bacterium]|jgi:hypothetical protein|nr:hypothetical protein [Spirochaetaceae bacterium]
MIFKLCVRPSDGTKLILGHAPLGRFLYLGIALFLIAGMATLKEAPTGLLLLTAIALTAGLYEERWVFDKDAGKASRIRGIGPASLTLMLPLRSLNGLILRVVSSPSPEEHIGSLEAAPVIPESLRRGRAVLLLAVDSENPAKPGTRKLVLEDGSHRERDSLESLGRAIAEYCGIPLNC